jgi:hypothetical protein
MGQTKEKNSDFSELFLLINVSSRTHIGRHSLSVNMLAPCEQLFVLCIALFRSSEKRIVTTHLRRMHVIVFQTENLFHDVILCPVNVRRLVLKKQRFHFATSFIIYLKHKYTVALCLFLF